MDCQVIQLCDRYVWNKSKCCIELSSRYPDAYKLDIFGNELGDLVLMFHNCIIRTPMFNSRRLYQISIYDANGINNYQISNQFIGDLDNRSLFANYFFTLNDNEDFRVSIFKSLLTCPKGLFEKGFLKFGMLPRRAMILYNQLHITDGCVFIYGMWCLVFDDNWVCQIFGVVRCSFIRDHKWELHLEKIIHCTSNEIIKRLMLGISL